IGMTSLETPVSPTATLSRNGLPLAAARRGPDLRLLFSFDLLSRGQSLKVAVCQRPCLSITTWRLFALLAALCTISGQAGDVFWTNPAGGNWSDTNNWNTGAVPGPADNAFITTNGSYEVVVGVNVSVANLNLGGGNGVQTLSWNGGSLSGALTVATNGVLNI